MPMSQDKKELGLGPASQVDCCENSVMVCPGTVGETSENFLSVGWAQWRCGGGWRHQAGGSPPPESTFPAVCCRWTPPGPQPPGMFGHTIPSPSQTCTVALGGPWPGWPQPRWTKR